jgi:cytochrome c peroxidase
MDEPLAGLAERPSFRKLVLTRDHGHTLAKASFEEEAVRTTTVCSLTTLVALTVVGGCAQPLTRPQAAGLLMVAHSQSESHAAAEIALGKQLFFDPRLSIDSSISCASCHDPKLGFSNGKAVGTGVGGAHGHRSVPTILSSGRQSFQFWDGRMKTLEDQALGPIQAPDEMAMPLPTLTKRLQGIPDYAGQFAMLYGGAVTPERVGTAIAAFERTFMAPEDGTGRLMGGDETFLKTLSQPQRAGYFVFRLKGCVSCHDRVDMRDDTFHNNGIGTDTPTPDIGRMKVTGDPADWAKFKTPTLRNVADTAPYMHDGSLATLRDVVDFYDKGGIANRNLDPKILPLHLEEWQKQDLVSFLSTMKTPQAMKNIRRP